MRVVMFVIAMALLTAGQVNGVSDNITLDVGSVAQLDVLEKLNSVAEKVFCPCGCGEILIDCHCETALSVKDDISQKLSQGATENQVLAYLVSLYGSSILVNEDVSKIRKSKDRSGLIPLYILGAGIFGILGYYFGRSRSRNDIPDYSRRVEEEIRKKKKSSKKTGGKRSRKKGRR